MITIRRATAADRDVLGRLGGALMRQHHASDPKRFLFVENPEAGYGRYLVSQLTDSDTLVMVAEESGAVLGYVYADIEETSWRDLRGPCGFVHDVVVDERARGRGIGRDLMRAAVEWMQSKGRPQVVLYTKTRNEHARHLFESLGFRPTMIEMTLDREGEGA
jgi:ribosomal protein S18 acetylase RimI-like enzyme